MSFFRSDLLLSNYESLIAVECVFSSPEWSRFVCRPSVQLSIRPLTLSNDNSSKAIEVICP